MSRRTASAAAAAAALLLSACGAAPEEPASPPMLAYTMPDVTPVTYTSSDTMSFNIHMSPAQSIEQAMQQTSTVRMSFAPSDTASVLAVTAEITDASASAENSMTGSQDVPESMLTGTYRFTLSPTGETELLEAPDVAPEAQQFAGADRFSDFFPRLPAEAVTPGEVWVDTLRLEQETEVGTTVNQAIVTSTFRGDTLIGNRSIWIIDSEKDISISMEGEAQGMEIRQELSGSASETVQWDPARSLLLSAVSSGSMSGTFSMPGAGMADIPVDATMRRRVQLVSATQPTP